MMYLQKSKKTDTIQYGDAGCRGDTRFEVKVVK